MLAQAQVLVPMLAGRGSGTGRPVQKTWLAPVRTERHTAVPGKALGCLPAACNNVFAMSVTVKRATGMRPTIIYMACFSRHPAPLYI